MTPWDVYIQYLLVFSSGAQSAVCYLITQIESIKIPVFRWELYSSSVKCDWEWLHTLFYFLHVSQPWWDKNNDCIITFQRYIVQLQVRSLEESDLELDFKFWDFYKIFLQSWPGLAWQAPGSPDWGAISQTQGWARSGFQYSELTFESDYQSTLPLRLLPTGQYLSPIRTISASARQGEERRGELWALSL